MHSAIAVHDGTLGLIYFRPLVMYRQPLTTPWGLMRRLGRTKARVADGF